MTPEEVALLSELTIIIPTYNRPLELERAIEYWRDTPVTVHILDGSEKPWFPIGKILGAATITYHNLSPKNGESSLRNYFRRISFARSLPFSKYVALCADDDFFTVSGMYEIIYTLEKDEMIDGMVGRCATYSRLEKVLWGTKYLELNASKKHLSNDPLVRLIDRANAPFLYYGILRRKHWNLLFEFSFKHEFSSTMTPFSVSRIIDSAICRTTSIDSLLWVRQAPVPRGSTANEKSLIIELITLRLFRERIKLAKLIYAAINTNFFENSVFRKALISWGLSSKKMFREWSVFSKAVKFWRKFLSRVLVMIPDPSKDVILAKIPDFVAGSIKRSGSAQRRANLRSAELYRLVNHFEELGISYNKSELVDFERIILMPREELRLRANI